MSNLQRKPQQEPEVSIYDPECAVNSPHIIEAWVDSLEFKPEDYEKYSSYFLTLIPDFCCEEDGTLPGPPEFWQRNLLSYSFFFGLGVTIFDRKFAQDLLYGLTEGWSRYALVCLIEAEEYEHVDNPQLWTRTVNILTALLGKASPETTAHDTDEELVKQRGSIVGFTPAIRLGLNDPEYARALFEGAVDERKNCDDEVLVDRINWIKAFIADVWSKNKARSSN